MADFRRSMIIASALLLSPGAVAFAADLPMPEPYIPEPVIAVPPPPPPAGCYYGHKGGGYHGGGRRCFYIRGDIGYADFRKPDVFEDNDTDFTYERLDNAWSIGGGVGLYLSEQFRADVTVEYREETDVEARDALQRAQHFTELDSLVGLLNVYYDFGCRCTFTPYVGMGLGVVEHETDRRVIISDWANVPQMSGPGNDNTDVAAAVMAGVSMGMSNGFLVDAGYRFIYLGDAETGPTDDGGWGPASIESIRAHEFRIGFRKELF